MPTSARPVLLSVYYKLSTGLYHQFETLTHSCLLWTLNNEPRTRDWKQQTQGFPQGSKAMRVWDGRMLRWDLLDPRWLCFLPKVLFDTDLLYVTGRTVCKSFDFLFVEEETWALRWKWSCRSPAVMQGSSTFLFDWIWYPVFQFSTKVRRANNGFQPTDSLLGILYMRRPKRTNIKWFSWSVSLIPYLALPFSSGGGGDVHL